MFHVSNIKFDAVDASWVLLIFYTEGIWVIYANVLKAMPGARKRKDDMKERVYTHIADENGNRRALLSVSSSTKIRRNPFKASIASKQKDPFHNFLLSFNFKNIFRHLISFFSFSADKQDFRCFCTAVFNENYVEG